MTDEEIRVKAIEGWMLNIVRDGGVERNDDFHVDRIDERWKVREFWIDGALESFRIALRLRDMYHLPFTVVLIVRLDDRSPNVTFGSGPLAGTDLSHSTPPSIYLFDPGHEPWNWNENVGNDKEPGQEYTIIPVNGAALTEGAFNGLTYLSRYRKGTDDVCSYNLLLGG